ncbi:hypothetical protein B0A70_05020 [Chryseobacterium piscicola]|uniref:Uncharacterized protein n=1 Tax=Chryseobacterium piscicola TaxID=551459 RepID=A0A2S7KHK4_9FLAO|nr:hypothetical protein B0A70_05020 [Chryseobacterium piscicola]
MFSCQLFSSQNILPEEKFSVSQNYIYLAKFEFYKKNYRKANGLFKKAFYYHSPKDSYDLLDAGAAALYSGENELFEKYIIESITKYKAPLEFIINYKKFEKYKNDSFFTELPAKYDVLYNSFFTTHQNLQVYLDSNLLMEKDQMIRDIISDLEKNTEETNLNKKFIYNQLIKIDEKNAQDLIDLTKKHGYQENTWLLLWHHRLQFNDENNFFWQFFKPYINKEIEQGKLHKSFFAMFEDFSEMESKQTQKYGMFPQSYMINPIKDIKNVDWLRNEVGLPPLLYDKIVNGYPIIDDKYQLSESDLQNLLEKRISKYEIIKANDN